jgi:hypothetical protein
MSPTENRFALLKKERILLDVLFQHYMEDSKSRRLIKIEFLHHSMYGIDFFEGVSNDYVDENIIYYEAYLNESNIHLEYDNSLGNC